MRTATRCALAVAALAVLVSVTACGPVLMGSAATFGTQRVSMATLSDQAGSLDKIYQANPSLQSEVQYTRAELPRLVLMWLVRFRVVDSIAQRNGVRVTSADAQAGLVQAAAQLQQQTASAVTPDVFAVLNALPPQLTGEYGRYTATIEKLAVAFTGAKSASALTTLQQQEFAIRLNAEAAAAAKRIGIKINPQYGRLNASQLTIDAPASPLSKAEALGAAGPAGPAG